jgi:anti-sigma factor RsiW
MDCPDVRDLSVAWLEGELSPGEAEQVAMHVETCTACADHLGALDSHAEVLRSLPPPVDEKVGQPGFWDKMDRAVAVEIDRAVATPPEPTPLWRRRLQVTPLGLAFYAAAMLLALGWGTMNLLAAQQAEARAGNLDAELQRERRLAVQPPAPSRAEQYRPAAYTPRRGTF